MRLGLKRTGALVFAAAALCSAPSARAQGRPPTPVYVAAVKSEVLQERRQVTGQLKAVSHSRVATIEPGIIEELPAVEGGHVKRGDVIAVLDRRRLEIELTRLAARRRVANAIEAARTATVGLKARDVEVLRALDAKRASNPKELADAESDLLVAEAFLEEAKAALTVIQAEADLVQTRLSDKRIRAPFDGVITSVPVERGEWLAEGDVVAHVVAVERFEAWLDVPQRFARWLVGTNVPVQILIDSIDRLEAPQIPRIVPDVDETARTFGVYVLVDNKDGHLAPGMTVIGWVPTGVRGEYLTLPRDAVLRNAGGPFVYVARATPGGPVSAAPVPIVVLFEHAGRVAVRATGLAAGDDVVVEGNERLFPMMPVSPIPIGSRPARGEPGEPGEPGDAAAATRREG